MKWSQRLGNVEFKHMHASIREYIPQPAKEEEMTSFTTPVDAKPLLALPPKVATRSEPPSELEEVRHENEGKKRRCLPGERLLKKLIKQQEETKLNKRIEKRLEKLLFA
jgi:hypothetical protein